MNRLVCIIAGFVLANGAAHALDGQLDPAFGTGGKATVDIGDWDGAQAMAVAPDGRIYMAGTAEHSVSAAIIRLRPDGSLDDTYGVGGSLIVDPQIDAISDIGLQASGKLVFASLDECGNCDVVTQQVCRLTAAGTGLDAAFGDPSTPGCRILQYDSDLQIYAFVIQGDGKIVLAGEKNERAWLYRLDAQGDPDATFGTNGEKIVRPDVYGYLKDVTVAHDGKIVAVGRIGIGTLNFETWRLTPTGIMDGSFGNGGQRTVAFDLGLGNTDYAQSVWVLSDGSVLIAGKVQVSEGYRPALVKLRGQDGGLDPQFGDQGKRVYSCPLVMGGCDFSGAMMIHVQSDKKIVVSGGVLWNFFTMRALANGTPDTSFGIQSPVPQGYAIVGFDSPGHVTYDGASGVAGQNGHLVLVGSTTKDEDLTSDFAVMRLRNDLIFTNTYER